MKTHREILDEAYEAVMSANDDEKASLSIPSEFAAKARAIVARAETNKGLIAVLVTLIAHKIFNPQQDVRFHQAQLSGGFAGRGVDSAYVTPFMKEKDFPAMAESGWLTRSLEQAHPYTLDYPGKIRPPEIKTAFLELVDAVQSGRIDAEATLRHVFMLLVKQRDASVVELAKPHKLSIARIIALIERHFEYRYTCPGASRLPVLALYAVYECLFKCDSRYAQKTLCPLESHNSADAQSGRIGDIDINNADGSAYEGIEVKHGIPITRQLVADAYEKFKKHGTDRYYLLTTASMDAADWEAIDDEIERIARMHGCQVIVNGVYSTLRYYLRIVPDTAEFIDRYVELMKCDTAIKYQHKTAWNDCVLAT